MKKYKLAIVGATGLVGRKILEVLEERNLPISEYKLFASKNSQGSYLDFKGEKYIVNELTKNSFDDNFDFAIFAAGSEIAKEFAPIAANHGCIVIDNSSFFRMDKKVPLVVPEVNPEDILPASKIIANPNCSTIQAVVALKPLDDNYRIKRIVYSTYQAVSGAGKKGIDDLTNSLNGLPCTKFPYSISKSCIPHIDVFLDNGYTKEEMKMINETRKILKKPTLPITATAVRVPILNSHSESINVEFEEDFDLDELKTNLKKSPGIIVQDDIKNSIYPISEHASGHDEVFVGRIRRDSSVSSGVNLWVVADNIRKGAASNAVQILEKIIQIKNNL